MTYQLFVGNNLEILPTLPDNSIDSIVTDPPYGLSDNKYVADTIARWIAGERDFVPDGKGFMGKSWDAFVPPPALWDQCLRVLKPGGHMLSFFGSRTQDIGALAIRLAGFEIRDSIAWLYGSGFPKSLNIGKAIDNAAGAEREVIGTYSAAKQSGSEAWSGKDRTGGKGSGFGETATITVAKTDEAKQWEGWGTALKPALEPIVVARKPIEGTVANNVLKWGTGGLNIDGSRIGTETISTHHAPKGTFAGGEQDRGSDTDSYKEHTGRWPANIILDPYTAELLDEQSGDRPGGNFPTQRGGGVATSFGKGQPTEGGARKMADSGGASRFFYVAKASKTDRSEGLSDLPLRKSDQRSEVAAGIWADMEAPKQNFHPTVKPTALMEYLIKLVTPPGGTVLDPFTGSGSTGKAAILSGFGFIGIEMTEDYVPIIEGRLKHAEKTFAEAKEQETLEETEKLF